MPFFVDPSDSSHYYCVWIFRSAGDDDRYHGSLIGLSGVTARTTNLYYCVSLLLLILSVFELSTLFLYSAYSGNEVRAMLERMDAAALAAMAALMVVVAAIQVHSQTIKSRHVGTLEIDWWKSICFYLIFLLFPIVGVIPLVRWHSDSGSTVELMLLVFILLGIFTAAALRLVWLCKRRNNKKVQWGKVSPR